jgi:hypothetical protein
LLRHDRFPTVWVPEPATRDWRALLTHRRRLVRMRLLPPLPWPIPMLHACSRILALAPEGARHRGRPGPDHALRRRSARRQRCGAGPQSPGVGRQVSTRPHHHTGQLAAPLGPRPSHPLMPRGSTTISNAHTARCASAADARRPGWP